MAEKILEVKNLSVTLDGEEILKNLSFSVSRGETVAIIGPNGAGKTVLLRALLGIVPYSGEIYWAPGIKQGYVPQRMDFDRRIPLTVKEFFLLKTKRIWIKAGQSIERFQQELALVGLDKDILLKPLGELSGGQLQRVLIAWALIDGPQVLFFDEPTSGIDIGSEETIYKTLHRLQHERSMTFLLISHDLNIVYKHASKVICLNKAMICEGPPREVLNPKELIELYGEAGFYHHFTHPPKL